MKLYSIIIALLVLGTANLSAQTATSVKETELSIRKKGKYALLVMKAQHLKVAIQTGIELKNKSGKIDFQILSCGELVKDISQSEELQNLIKTAVQEHGLQILICGLSIDQFKVDKTLLPKESLITKNGLIYILGLQEQGYKTIIL